MDINEVVDKYLNEKSLEKETEKDFIIKLYDKEGELWMTSLISSVAEGVGLTFQTPDIKRLLRGESLVNLKNKKGQKFTAWISDTSKFYTGLSKDNKI